jgi:hypothetical protein
MLGRCVGALGPTHQGDANDTRGSVGARRPDRASGLAPDPPIRAGRGERPAGVDRPGGRALPCGARGVRYTQGGKAQALATDVVVDAGGRKSQAPRWLMALGFRAPEATTIGVDIAYASTKFRVPEGYDRPERLLVFMGPPPDVPNGAVMEIIEDQT